VLVDLDVDLAEQAALTLPALCLPAFDLRTYIRRKMILATWSGAIADPALPRPGTVHILILPRRLFSTASIRGLPPRTPPRLTATAAATDDSA